jgi:hypothetical protein
MSDEEFHREATYPNHYQAEHYREDRGVGETVEERAHHTRARYRQRLKEQVRELTSENLPSALSEEDRNEILTEVIEDALMQVVKDCKEVANDSGLSEGKVVAELIEKKFSGRTRENVLPL